MCAWNNFITQEWKTRHLQISKSSSIHFIIWMKTMWCIQFHVRLKHFEAVHGTFEILGSVQVMGPDGYHFWYSALKRLPGGLTGQSSLSLKSVLLTSVFATRCFLWTWAVLDLVPEGSFSSIKYGDKKATKIFSKYSSPLSKYSSLFPHSSSVFTPPV